MNKIYIILPILASLLTFSSHSNGEWTFVVKSVNDHKFYIDLDRITKGNGYVYAWLLKNSLEPDQWGDLSSINYLKVDCGVPRKYMSLKFMSYDQHFGNGNNTTTFTPEINWQYMKPDSSNEIITNFICLQ